MRIVITAGHKDIEANGSSVLSDNIISKILYTLFGDVYMNPVVSKSNMEDISSHNYLNV